MSKFFTTAAVAAGLFIAGSALAQDVPRSEFPARRTRLMEELPDGLTLIHARSSEKAMEQWGFIQDGTFQYFTGFPNLAGAILGIDGPRGEARLWIPPGQSSFGEEIQGFGIGVGDAEARAHGLASVEMWGAFVPWVRSRLADGMNKVYLDGPRRPEATGAPPGMRPVSGDRTLWRSSVEDAFPGVTIASAKEAIQRLRWRKSPAEVEILAANARATVIALRAVAGAVRSGVNQRAMEAVVAATCIERGAQGPSFWPWLMSGPNAHTGQLVRAFFQYDQLDRTMRAGEVVRVDIGCAGGGYGADVGRTLPVGGRFTAGQREAWDLVVSGYHAGLRAMRAGVALDEVRRASVAEIGRRRPELTTEQGRAAADTLLSRGLGVWHIHGIGIESGEEAVDPLVDGAVIAYEPTVEVGPDAFYLEDMILITPTGHRVLSTDLPYTAAEIEDFMRGGR
jgi:Xaa-Pro aminopeptidase